VPAKAYRRVLESRVGQVGYDGLVLDANLGSLISDASESGASSASIRENHLIFIGSHYYSISSVDGSSLILGGPLGAYTKSGEEVDFTVYRFTKQSLSLRERFEPPVPGFEFDSVDRSGKALISSVGEVVGVDSLSTALNCANSGQPFDASSQEENIEFTVEYRDGEER
jgi:hypothetical protein